MAQIVNSLAAATTTARARLYSRWTQIEMKLEDTSRSSSRRRGVTMSVSVIARERGNNRKPLQRGRSLSTEAIQTIQALKRAYNKTNTQSQQQQQQQQQRLLYSDSESESAVSRVVSSQFMRLLKLDMMAILRELLRQNHCFLALKVFEEIRKEPWYKPQVSLYADMIAVMGRNGLWDQIELLYMYLRTEHNLEPDVQGFNQLFTALMKYNLTTIVKECYDLMKVVGCEPDRSAFKLLVNGLESIGELEASAVIKQDAQKCYGQDLDFLIENDEEITIH